MNAKQDLQIGGKSPKGGLLLLMYLCRNSLSDWILGFWLKLSPQSLTLHRRNQSLVRWYLAKYAPQWIISQLKQIDTPSETERVNSCMQNVVITSSHELEARGSAESRIFLSWELGTPTVPSMSEDKSTFSILSGFSSKRMAAITDKSFSDCTQWQNTTFIKNQICTKSIQSPSSSTNRRRGAGNVKRRVQKLNEPFAPTCTYILTWRQSQ